MDEDWGELLGNPDVTADPSGLYAIASNLEPRSALDRSTSGNRQIKAVVCDPAATSDTLPQTIALAAGSGEVSEDATDNQLFLSRRVGE